MVRFEDFRPETHPDLWRLSLLLFVCGGMIMVGISLQETALAILGFSFIMWVTMPWAFSEMLDSLLEKHRDEILRNGSLNYRLLKQAGSKVG